MSYPYYYRLAADYIADEQQEKAFRSGLIGVIDSLIENAVFGEQRIAIRYLYKFAGPVGTADDVVETISIYRNDGDVLTNLLYGESTRRFELDDTRGVLLAGANYSSGMGGASVADALKELINHDTSQPGWPDFSSGMKIFDQPPPSGPV